MFCQVGDSYTISDRKSMVAFSGWVESKWCGVFVRQNPIEKILPSSIGLVGFFFFCLFFWEVKWGLSWVWNLFCSNCVRIMVGPQTSLSLPRTNPWIPLWRCLMLVAMTPMGPACDSWATGNVSFQDPITRCCLAKYCWGALGYSWIFCWVPYCNRPLGSEQLLSPSLSCHLAPSFSLSFWQKKSFYDSSS